MKIAFKLNIMIIIRTEFHLFFFIAEKRGDNLCKRNENPKRNSRFICLRCLQENKVGAGIQDLKQKRRIMLRT